MILASTLPASEGREMRHYAWSVLFVYKNNVGIYLLLWETLGIPVFKDTVVQPTMQSTSTILNDLGRDAVRTGCLIVLETENGLLHLVK